MAQDEVIIQYIIKLFLKYQNKYFSPFLFFSKTNCYIRILSLFVTINSIPCIIRAIDFADKFHQKAILILFLHLICYKTTVLVVFTNLSYYKTYILILTLAPFCFKLSVLVSTVAPSCYKTDIFTFTANLSFYKSVVLILITNLFANKTDVLVLTIKQCNH